MASGSAGRCPDQPTRQPSQPSPSVAMPKTTAAATSDRESSGDAGKRRFAGQRRRPQSGFRTTDTAASPTATGTSVRTSRRHSGQMILRRSIWIADTINATIKSKNTAAAKPGSHNVHATVSSNTAGTNLSPAPMRCRAFSRIRASSNIAAIQAPHGTTLAISLRTSISEPRRIGPQSARSSHRPHPDCWW